MPKCLLALSVLLISTCLTYADSERVGSLGDPQRWQIHGLKSLEPDVVLRQLKIDREILFAAHPQAPLTELTPTILKQMLLGLQHSGYRDAFVAVRVDHDKGIVVIDAEEGMRSSAGKVIVTGMECELSDNIVAALTGSTHDSHDAAPQSDLDGNVWKWSGDDGTEPAEQKVLWKSGQPAPFDDVTLLAIQQRINCLLEDAGYRSAEFEVSLAPREAVADLVVNVTDLGPQSVLRAIEIDGNERDTDDEISRYLGVQLGERVTKQRRIELLRSLWESGRFASQDVTFKSNANGTTLQIRVVEIMGAPRLNDPLPRHTLALLKFRTWLIAGEGQSRDFVVTSVKGEDSWEMTASRDGLLFALNGTAGPDAVPEYAATIGKKGISWYEVGNHHKLLSEKMVLPLTLEAGIAVIYNQDGRQGLQLHLKYRSGRNGQHEPPFLLKTSIQPACFVGLGGNPEVRPMWDDAILTLTTENGLLRIDSTTGEFLGFEGKDFNVRAIANQFQNRQQQLDDVTRGDADQFDPAQPLSSVAGFLGHSTAIPRFCELLAASETSRAKLAAGQCLLRSLADRGLLGWMDVLVGERPFPSGTNTEFEIPQAERTVSYTDIVALVAVFCADDLFPRESWPWSIWRESALTALGDTRYQGSECAQVVAGRKAGPLGHWILVELFSRLDCEALAAFTAQHGLHTLDRFSFRSDCELLLGNLWPKAYRGVRWLENLNDQELDAVATLVSVDRATLQSVRESLATASDDKSLAALLSALEHMWVTKWHVQADARMRQAIAAKPAEGKNVR